jgi:hypothetical protein
MTIAVGGRTESTDSTQINAEPQEWPTNRVVTISVFPGREYGMPLLIRIHATSVAESLAAETFREMENKFGSLSVGSITSWFLAGTRESVAKRYDIIHLID